MMPTRNLYRQESNGLFLIDPRAFINQQVNVFDKSFGADMKLEDWKDWMRWDGATAEPEPTVLGRRDMFESTLSSAADLDTVLFPARSTDTTFSFEDAPFELDESTDPSQFPLTSQIPLDVRRSVRGNSTPTAAKEQRPRDKERPYRMLSQAKTPSEPRSPTTSISSPSHVPSPDPEIRTRKPRKRKPSIDEDDVPNTICQSKNRSHNAIEKRYRANLNDKITCLGQGIPPLWRRYSTDSRSGDDEDSGHETTDKKVAHKKYGKAAILTRALEYIQHLESTTTRLSDEVTVLRTRVGALERLAISGIVMKSAAVPTGMLTPKKETPQTIHADFKRIKPKSKSVSGAAGSRRNSTKLGK